jgi:D-cysteine desulfhydrase
LETATAALLALGGGVIRGPARLTIDAAWMGAGYGHPTDDGEKAMAAAAAYGLELEPTYTAKAFAAALARVERGERVVFVHTFGGGLAPHR